MTTYKERMDIEAQALADRIVKLSEFRLTDVYAGLEPIDQHLLDEQHKHMSAYLKTLRLRISIAK